VQVELSGELLRNGRTAFIAIGVASALISIHFLIAFYMLEVYDRIAPTHLSWRM